MSELTVWQLESLLGAKLLMMYSSNAEFSFGALSMSHYLKIQKS
jgi:hypothetical protein